MIVGINIIGCDDSTDFSFEVTEEEYKLLKRIEEKSEETSTYQCMPVFKIIDEEEWKQELDERQRFLKEQEEF